MNTMKPYNDTWEYSTYQLEQYWYAYETDPNGAVDALAAYYHRIQELLRADPDTGTQKVKEALFAWLNVIANKACSMDLIEEKCSLLQGWLDSREVCRRLWLDDDGRYALASTIMYSAVASNNTVDRPDWNEEYHKSLNGFFTTTLMLPENSKPVSFTQDVRVSYLLAQHIMPQEWCVLIEPSLNTLEDVVNALWIERPPMLSYNQIMDSRPAQLSMLPPTDIADTNP